MRWLLTTQPERERERQQEIDSERGKSHLFLPRCGLLSALSERVRLADTQDETEPCQTYKPIYNPQWLWQDLSLTHILTLLSVLLFIIVYSVFSLFFSFYFLLFFFILFWFFSCFASLMHSQCYFNLRFFFYNLS